MTKTLTFLTAAALSTEALAHAGHVEEVAGHSHWGEIAIVAALTVAFVVWAVRRARKTA
jgi:hypothetical protein